MYVQGGPKSKPHFGKFMVSINCMKCSRETIIKYHQQNIAKVKYSLLPHSVVA